MVLAQAQSAIEEGAGAADFVAAVGPGGLLGVDLVAGLVAAGGSVDVDGFNTVSDFSRLGSKVSTRGNGYTIRMNLHHLLSLSVLKVLPSRGCLARGA